MRTFAPDPHERKAKARGRRTENSGAQSTNAAPTHAQSARPPAHPPASMSERDRRMECMRIRRVATLLDISPKRVYQLIEEGAFEVVRFGPRQTRVLRTSVEAFIADSQPVESEDEF